MAYPKYTRILYIRFESILNTVNMWNVLKVRPFFGSVPPDVCRVREPGSEYTFPVSAQTHFNNKTCKYTLCPRAPLSTVVSVLTWERKSWRNKEITTCTSGRDDTKRKTKEKKRRKNCVSYSELTFMNDEWHVSVCANERMCRCRSTKYAFYACFGSISFRCETKMKLGCPSPSRTHIHTWSSDTIKPKWTKRFGIFCQWMEDVTMGRASSHTKHVHLLKRWIFDASPCMSISHECKTNLNSVHVS